VGVAVAAEDGEDELGEQGPRGQQSRVADGGECAEGGGVTDRVLVTGGAALDLAAVLDRERPRAVQARHPVEAGDSQAGVAVEVANELRLGCRQAADGARLQQHVLVLDQARVLRWVQLEDEGAVGPRDGKVDHRRADLVLDPGQPGAVRPQLQLRQQVAEAHRLRRVELDARRHDSRLSTGRHDLHVADRVVADGQQQGQLVVHGGLDRPAQGAEPAALGQQPGEEPGQRTAGPYERVHPERQGRGDRWPVVALDVGEGHAVCRTGQASGQPTCLVDVRLGHLHDAGRIDRHQSGSPTRTCEA